MLQADEMIDDDEMIDRVLDSNLRIIRHFQSVPMQQGTTTFFDGPMLTWVQNIHDGGCPHTRRIVQRALFRAGHTNLHAFATGHVIAWLTTGILDQGEGRGEIIYLTPRMEAILWRGVAAREPDARWSFVESAPDSEPDDVTRAPHLPTSALVIRSITNRTSSEADFGGPRWSFVESAPDSEPHLPTSALIIRSISNIPISEADFCGPDEPDEPRT